LDAVCQRLVMPRIRLEVAADLVLQFVREKEPVKAVAELIWNALDADAHNVAVVIDLNAAGNPDRVTVADDGHGMSPKRVDDAFRRVGGSWKSTALISEGEKRPLHGRSGRGRLRAFALGSIVRWTTVAEDPEGKRWRTVITSKDSSCNDFDVSEPVETDDACGTTVEAWAKQSPYLPRLLADRAAGDLEAALAPTLLAYDDVHVIYNSHRLNPIDNVELDTTYELTFTVADKPAEAKLRVIEWKSGGDCKIHLCDERNVPIDEVKFGINMPDFKFSAYTLWESMADHRSEYIVEDLDPPIAGLLKAAKTKLREHLDDRRQEQAQRLIEQWKTEHVYPYAATPTTDAELAEQAMFNVVSTQIQRHLPASRKGKQITLNLLKSSLQQRPGEITRILASVLDLSPEDRSHLDRLLERTSLGAVIKTAASIANRLDFLAALDHIVFNPDISGLIGERAHLHKILEGELWIFGEQYNMMVSERGLTEVLRRHLQHLGRDTKRLEPVTRADGRLGRVDLALTTMEPVEIGDQQVAVADVDHDRNRHLVIELKAPNVIGKQFELDQIKSYAKAVAEDSRFAHPTTEWDFWLVVKDVDDYVDDERSQKLRTYGIAHEPVPRNGITYRVWVKTWSEILEDCRRRLKFHRDNLDHDPSIDHAVDYLRFKYNDLLPEQLRAPEPEDTAQPVPQQRTPDS
jgi:Histidine kinase-, DNA gyrase B-, and HSP90-like ATPase